MRKREVALRLLRGESLEALSRELAVEIHRLQRWRDRALSGIDESLREREGDPMQGELDAAIKRVGELSMGNELIGAVVMLSGSSGRIAGLKMPCGSRCADTSSSSPQWP
jgi:hypothetical protein